jgi:hypothetical protein
LLSDYSIANQLSFFTPFIQEFLFLFSAGEVTAHGFPLMPYPSACPRFPLPAFPQMLLQKNLLLILKRCSVIIV